MRPQRDDFADGLPLGLMRYMYFWDSIKKGRAMSGATRNFIITAFVVSSYCLALDKSNAQSLPVNDLISIYAELNEMCRGWSGDDPHTNQVCAVREKVAAFLKSIGYCYGEKAQFSSEMNWHRCLSK